MQWLIKFQKHKGWSNQKWADESNVPVGTINRLKAGDTDCKYSTIRSLAISVMGGTTDEFSCTEQVEKELRQMEQLEQQAARMSSVEKENEELRQRLEEYRDLNAFLKKENDRKAKIIDKFLD
jgi:predicted transcriptional regulator